jgi:hypothetical protein
MSGSLLLKQDLKSIQEEDEDYEKLKLKTFDIPNSSVKYWTMVSNNNSP